MSSTSTLPPKPPPAHAQHQHQEEQEQHSAKPKPKQNSAQTSQPAMILNKDYTKIVGPALTRIQFPITEPRAKRVFKKEMGAVMVITIGPKKLLPGYYLIKFRLVGVLVKWMYSDLAIDTTNVQLEMRPGAANDPAMQKQVIAVFGELRGLQNVHVRSFNPKTAGAALTKTMKSPLQNMTQAFQRIDAFRFRIDLEMIAWENKCPGNMDVYKRLSSTFQTAIRCMDQYHALLKSSQDWDGERFIDRKIYLLTEQLFTKFVCCGREWQNLTHARQCMLQMVEDGAPVVAREMLRMRLCDIELIREHPKRAGKYLAKVEKVQPNNKDVQERREEVERMKERLNGCCR
ncbi:MAG: hypothetical protein Q9221_001423 [Calogaya cf. arnoldii]